MTSKGRIQHSVRSFKRALATAFAFASFGSAWGGEVIFISSSNVSPTEESDYRWNACPLDYAADTAYTPDSSTVITPHIFTGLVDSEGKASNVKLFLMSPANGHHARTVGEFTGDAAEFEPIRLATSQRATYHVFPENTTSSAHEPEIRARFTGLDPDKLYEFSFMAFGSTGKDLSGKYTVIGATTETRIFNPAGNTTKVVRIPAVAPLPDGSVEFTLAPAEANNHANKAVYISAIKIEEMDSLPAQDIYIDAYKAGTETYNSGIAWNAVTLNKAGVSLDQLKDSNGNTTPIGIVATAGNGSGIWRMRLTGTLTGDAAVFGEAVSDSNQGEACLIDAADVFKATVNGLYPNCTYTFTFLASYGGTASGTAGKDKKVVYSVVGENSGSSVLDTWENTSNVATVSGIRPKADGTVEISYQRDDGENNYNYAYLAAFRISRDAVATVVEKPVFVKATSGGRVSATVGGEASSCERYLSSGQTLVATATPDSGFRFVGWTSSWTNATETVNPLSIPATQAVTWTAVFEKDDQYVTKTMYVDAYGTPAADGKTWNSFGNGPVVRGEWKGPFLASDGSNAAVGITTICPFGVKNGTGASPKNATANIVLTGDAEDFNAARASGNDQLYMHVGLNTYTNRAIVVFDVHGLKPRRAYTLRFMSTNSDNYYHVLCARCTGENQVTAYVDPVGNASSVAKAENVRPDASGVIRVALSSAPQNEYVRGSGTAADKMLVCFTAFSIEGDISETDAKRILWFGNSFAGNGDIPGRVADLAELAGYERPVIVKSLKNSSALAYHIETVTNTPEANVEAPEIMYMTSRGWDDVVIQGRMLEAASGTAALNGYPEPSEGFIPLATNLYALVRGSAKGGSVRGVLYQTWPYADGASEVYPSVYVTPGAMEDEIAANYDAVKDLINGKWGSGSAVVAPVGMSYAKARFGADFYHSDNYHQGGKYGYELVSMVLFNRLYNVKVEECVTYAQALASGWTALTESEWNRLRRYAGGKGMVIVFR